MVVFERLLAVEAARLAYVLAEWSKNLPEGPLTPGEEALLRVIKRGVARRAEGREKCWGGC